MSDIRRFVEESNRIEGIVRDATDAEVRAAGEFLDRPVVTAEGLVALVAVFQPDARLRDKPGLNVRVGNHYPPPGGPQILAGLEEICVDAEWRTPYEIHHAYETLHPFTDGNGRSGRMLWLWQHVRSGTSRYISARGFLHSWYYESLAARRAPTAEGEEES